MHMARVQIKIYRVCSYALCSVLCRYLRLQFVIRLHVPSNESDSEVRDPTRLEVRSIASRLTSMNEPFVPHFLQMVALNFRISASVIHRHIGTPGCQLTVLASLA
jgi:hypothetical protein